jgi:hypothetical protein
MEKIKYQINYHFYNRYVSFIQHYKQNPMEGFCEKHHIVPRCMGGNDSVDNLILIPVRVHFILHFLLYKSFPDNKKLAHAFSMMAVNNKHQNRKISSKMYELTKLARSNALRGVSRPEYVKEKLRVPKKNKDNYKKPKSQLHAQNISNSLKGKKKSDEHIKNMILAKQNEYKRRSEEMEERKKHYRNLFIESGLSRKDFFMLYNLNPNTGKRYLRGL